MTDQEDPASKIATRKELKDLIADRPQPRPTVAYTPSGPIRTAVDGPINKEAEVKREARIRELAEKLSAQRGHAVRDFDRER